MPRKSKGSLKRRKSKKSKKSKKSRKQRGGGYDGAVTGMPTNSGVDAVSRTKTINYAEESPLLTSA
jgi:hypothetical protein